MAALRLPNAYSIRSSGTVALSWVKALEAQRGANLVLMQAECPKRVVRCFWNIIFREIVFRYSYIHPRITHFLSD